MSNATDKHAEQDRAMRLVEDFIRRSEDTDAVGDMRKPLMRRVIKALKAENVQGDDLLWCAKHANENLCCPPLTESEIEFQVVLTTESMLSAETTSRILAEQDALAAAEQQRYRIVLDEQPDQTQDSKLLLAKDVAPVLGQRSLVKGMIAPESISLWYGPSGVGKSSTVINFVSHVATGRPWFGRKTEQTGVLYCAAEGWAGFKNRVAAVKQQLGVDDLPVALTNSPPVLCSKNADHTEDFLNLVLEAGTLLSMPIGIICFDTLNAAFAGGDENSTADMTIVIKRLVEIRDRTGAHILLIHHVGKDAARGPRGSSALIAAVDAAFEFSPEREIWTRKQRDLPEALPIGYELETVTLGHDADGTPVTACVARPAHHAASLSGPTAKALEVLRSALDREGTDWNGQRTVPESRWRALCLEAKLSKGTRESERKAFTRVKASLRHLVVIKRGHVWIAAPSEALPPEKEDLFPVAK